MLPPDRFRPEIPRDGQESVWSYPRPSVAQPTTSQLRVEFGGIVIAETTHGIRTLETSHPPTYYFPPGDILLAHLQPADHGSYCEWKGMASYYDIIVGDKIARNAAWSYTAPKEPFLPLKGFFAFYCSKVDHCYVDDDRAIPQPGLFYGGWVTSKIAGPFKGSPGTDSW